MKLAFLFPGQGSQKVGMGQELAQEEPAAQELYRLGEVSAGWDLSTLCWEGPAEKLNQTSFTQPCIVTTSLATFAVLKERGIEPEAVAGHSLGEYSALVAAGVLQPGQAISLVAKRGKLMEEAVPEGGQMAAVLGLDAKTVEEICKRVSGEVGAVEPANFNSPGQIVVSGWASSVEEFSAQAKEAGAKRVIPLKTSGPFHSSLMERAIPKWKEIMAKVQLEAAGIPFVSNVTATYLVDPEEIRDVAVEQLKSPVRWEQSMGLLVAEGYDTFVEVGPGQVLAGLMRRIAPQVRVLTTDTYQNLVATIEELGRSGSD